VNQKRFVNLIVVLGVLIVAGTAGYFLWHSSPTTTSKKPPIVNHFACSDYCPGPAEKYTVKVYQGVTDPEECKKIGGKPSTYYGWGEFHICIAE